MGLSKESPFYPLEAERIIMASERWIAFYDRYPVSPGHALVIPCKPVASLFDAAPELQAEIWSLVRQVREILVAKHQPDGFNIGLNDGVAAGQTVMHTHIHIIPRYHGDVSDPRGGIRHVIPAKANYWD